MLLISVIFCPTVWVTCARLLNWLLRSFCEQRPCFSRSIMSSGLVELPAPLELGPLALFPLVPPPLPLPFEPPVPPVMLSWSRRSCLSRSRGSMWVRFCCLERKKNEWMFDENYSTRVFSRCASLPAGKLRCCSSIRRILHRKVTAEWVSSWLDSESNRVLAVYGRE